MNALTPAPTRLAGACPFSRRVDLSDRLPLRNLTRFVAEDVDVAASASRSLWGGLLNAHACGTYLTKVSSKSSDEGSTFEVAGTYVSATSWPQWRAQAAVDWLRGPWRASYVAQFIDAMRECGDKIFPPNYAYFAPDECRTIDSRVYHDISGAFRFHFGLTLSGAIENVSNALPPRINTSYMASRTVKRHPAPEPSLEALTEPPCSCVSPARYA